MIEVRPLSSLGGANHGWLDTKFHFSFADYFDQRRLHWGALRVWNDDRIAPRSGFPPHPHSDMEIITYVRSGAITHKDSMGNTGRTGAGDVQVMSAGTGVQHAEYNLEDVETTLFQIWIVPDRDKLGSPPRWDMKPFPKGERSGRFVTLASGRKADDAGEALPIYADARVMGATIPAGETVTVKLGEKRKAYLVPATGRIEVDGQEIGTRDGAAIADLDTISVTAIEDAEVVLVETA